MRLLSFPFLNVKTFLHVVSCGQLPLQAADTDVYFYLLYSV